MDSHEAVLQDHRMLIVKNLLSVAESIQVHTKGDESNTGDPWDKLVKEIANATFDSTGEHTVKWLCEFLSDIRDELNKLHNRL